MNRLSKALGTIAIASAAVSFAPSNAADDAGAAHAQQAAQHTHMELSQHVRYLKNDSEQEANMAMKRLFRNDVSKPEQQRHEILSVFFDITGTLALLTVAAVAFDKSTKKRKSRSRKGDVEEKAE